MISIELLRRYPFFGKLDEEQLIQIAMITEEVTYEKNSVIFEIDQPATALFLLMEGSIDLAFKVPAENIASGEKDLFVGEINPGEVFGISAMIEPYVYALQARTSKHSSLLQMDAVNLRELSEKDCSLGYRLLQQITKTSSSRLHDTRVQLAAAWA